MSRERTVDGVRFMFSECINCGISYSVPKNLWDKQVERGGFHHCPNGHSQGWNKEDSEIEKLRRERDVAKQQIARADDERREALDRAAKAEAATKRIKKRASAGNCPCCKRTFKNMAEHMKHMHPEFVAEGGTKVVPIKRGHRRPIPADQFDKVVAK